VFGLKADWSLKLAEEYFTIEDYTGAQARWCPGCGDHAVLTAVQKVCRDEQLPPERTVVVSGIGCSSRFPHHMGTYGFHGLHGRALPVACGVKSRRPDLHVFVATGDGDCCSIGAGHWVHAVRYNMDMTVLLFDNAVYGLTKKQTSPTSHPGFKTNTHPKGAFLPPLNPLQTTLGFTNASFVAQTIDWNPAHLYATIKAGFEHRGLAFIRVLQRCPTYSSEVYEQVQNDPALVLYLHHPDGIPLEDNVARMYKTRQAHDPSDLSEARDIAERSDVLPIGLLFRDATRPVYDDFSQEGLDMSVDDRLAALERILDKYSLDAGEADPS
jgi:2-oxoglutarate ferredoxin oxidoreductase subunit beta